MDCTFILVIFFALYNWSLCIPLLSEMMGNAPRPVPPKPKTARVPNKEPALVTTPLLKSTMKKPLLGVGDVSSLTTQQASKTADSTQDLQGSMDNPFLGTQLDAILATKPFSSMDPFSSFQNPMLGMQLNKMLGSLPLSQISSLNFLNGPLPGTLPSKIKSSTSDVSQKGKVYVKPLTSSVVSKTSLSDTKPMIPPPTPTDVVPLAVEQGVKNRLNLNIDPIVKEIVPLSPESSVKTMPEFTLVPTVKDMLPMNRDSGVREKAAITVEKGVKEKVSSPHEQGVKKVISKDTVKKNSVISANLPSSGSQQLDQMGFATGTVHAQGHTQLIPGGSHVRSSLHPQSAMQQSGDVLGLLPVNRDKIIHAEHSLPGTLPDMTIPSELLKPQASQNKILDQMIEIVNPQLPQGGVKTKFGDALTEPSRVTTTDGTAESLLPSGDSRVQSGGSITKKELPTGIAFVEQVKKQDVSSVYRKKKAKPSKIVCNLKGTFNCFKIL